MPIAFSDDSLLIDAAEVGYLVKIFWRGDTARCAFAFDECLGVLVTIVRVQRECDDASHLVSIAVEMKMEIWLGEESRATKVATVQDEEDKLEQDAQGEARDFIQRPTACFAMDNFSAEHHGSHGLEPFSPGEHHAGAFPAWTRHFLQALVFR